MMGLRHSLYALALSFAYFVIGQANPRLAESMTIFFVVLILIPAPFSWHRR